MDLLVVILLIVIIVLILWILSQQKSNQPSSSTIVNEIIARLSQNNTQNIAQILEEYAKSYQNQEKRFNDLEKNLLTQTDQLKDQNQKSLLSILAQVRDQLAKSISELNQRNKENFELLNNANKEKLNQLEIEISKKLDENLAQNLKSFENVTKNLTQMETKAQQMIESTKSIDRLNSIFDRTSAKAFGKFGENYLESLLQQHLSPNSWKKQVKLPNTDYILDFIILIDNKQIGIDSKFPLTKYQDFVEADIANKKTALGNFLHGVMAMAKSIYEKYAQHAQIDSVIIFFPSEGMYNEVVNNEQTLRFLQDKKIQPASPSTIFALIMLIHSHQYRNHINENAQLIIDGLKVVRKNIDSFREEFRKLGDKLRQAQNNYDIADRSLLTVQNEVLKLESTEKQEILEQS